MSSKNIGYLSYVVVAGIFVLPVLSLLVGDSMFFPFITAKNFFFRIAVEILLFLWIVLAVFDRSFRPKKSPVLIALSAFLAVLILAAIFGENPFRSFWSNYERMEGLVSHFHLFAYFLVLTSVFRREKNFKWFFAALIFVSVIISFWAYLQLLGKADLHQGSKLDASFGNSTYLAMYIVFHLFLIGWLFFKSVNPRLKGFLAFLFVFELPVIYYTMTRGAILGFFGGLLIFAFLMAILSKARRLRYSFLAVLGVLALTAVLFIVFKDSAFIKTRPTLAKLTSISFSEGTVESRLTIWKMSLEALKEHPILGWGPDNFNLVFNKFYKPNLWSKEPWFDRAHNVVFDWLISAGILGFVAYLGILLSGLYVLWKGFRRGLLRPAESSLFVGLLAAYFFQNLFVFDNIVSYFLFFSILGYLHCVYKGQSSKEQDYSQISKGQIGIGHYLVISISLLAVVFSLYFANIKPLLANFELLNTLKDISLKGQDVDAIIKDFDKVFSYKTFGTGEAREQLAGYANNVLSANANIPEENKIKVLQKAIEEMETQVKSNPKDARYYIMLGSLYQKAGRYEDALTTLNKAVELSPKKQQIRFLLADVYLSIGRNEEAFEAVKQAYEFDPRYDEAIKNLAVVAAAVGRESYAEELLIKHFGSRIIAEKQLLNAYARAGNYEKVKEIWLLFVEKEPTNAQYRVSLAATYVLLGEREKAIKELQKAVEFNPAFKDQAEYYIKELQAGRTP